MQRNNLMEPYDEGFYALHTGNILYIRNGYIEFSLNGDDTCTFGIKTVYQSNCIYSPKKQKLLKDRSTRLVDNISLVYNHVIDGYIYVSWLIVERLHSLSVEEQRNIIRHKLLNINVRPEIPYSGSFMSSLDVDIPFHDGILKIYSIHLLSLGDGIVMYPLLIERLPIHIKDCDNPIIKSILTAIWDELNVN